MDATANATPNKVDAKPTKADDSQITVTTTPLSETEAVDVSSHAKTEWKITIKSSDGATSEVLLSPASAKNPRCQEINIFMPGAKATDDGGDVEKAKKEEPAPPSLQMRIWTIGQQALTAIFSSIIIAVMALTLVKYRSTQNVKGAWPTNPLLTPTYVLLAMAVLTCVADLVTLGVKSAAMRTVEQIRTSMGFLQAIATAAGAGYFKWAQTSTGGADLWGWSCSDAADAMQSVDSLGTLYQTNTALHVIAVVLALWALMNPEGTFKDHTAEASQLLADSESTETTINTDFGPPAKA